MTRGVALCGALLHWATSEFPSSALCHCVNAWEALFSFYEHAAFVLKGSF